MGEDEPLRLHLDDDSRENASFHRWFATRGANAARAAVALTISPGWLTDPGRLALIADGDDAAIASAIAQDRGNQKSGSAGSASASKEERLLDLCAGVGTVADAAARLGLRALSVESSIVPHLINKVLHDYAISMAKPSLPVTNANTEGSGAWRGFATEVEDFANAVWRGAKNRLKGLFEEDVDIRLWVRIVPCLSCGAQVPVLSNVRLSRDIALDVSPDSGFERASVFPRFGLLRTEFPDRKGTFARGICTCPACHFQFDFHGHDLISLRSVPVAVRTRDSSVLVEIDSPDVYVVQTDAAAHRSIAASSRNLGNRTVLADQQSIFHDARGEPISVRNALLPRQRAYFAALAESMARESVLLAERGTLTTEHRTAVRSAVALLISGQVDYVNTYAHWLVDKPHPSTFAGSLRLCGLFTEVGGYSLERLWQSRLRHLLSLLQERISSTCAVQAIHADAADIPIGDSSVSAVVWDPPYYDDVDYDVFGEPFQAILAAVVPDLADEPAVAPRLPRTERTARYERELVQQAREARRVVRPDGAIGVFWLTRKSTEPDRKPGDPNRFIKMITPVGLQLVRVVRLDTIPAPRVMASAGPETYLLVLKPIASATPAVVVDTEKVLARASVGALSLYDGLAELLESVWDPADLDRIVPGEFHGSSRQRLAGFLASHPRPEDLLVDELGRMTLARELVNRGADGDEIRLMDADGLAQQLLSQLGFAVARPVRFSIRAALRECDRAMRSQLGLADTLEAVTGAFKTCYTLIERSLRYAYLAWSLLACDDRWDEVLTEIVRSARNGRPFQWPGKLTFGEHEQLFIRLPTIFAGSDYASEKVLFEKVSWAMKKAKAHDKLGALVTLRNDFEHNDSEVISLTVPQLRERCSTKLAEACAVLEKMDGQQLLPLTVRPEQERRDRYGRRVLQMLDPDGVAMEVHVGSETDLTEPLIYFPSDDNRRTLDPRFLRAVIVEELLGLS